MATEPARSPSTEQHAGPASARADDTFPALICAWPRCVALPLPQLGHPVGRDWLAAVGVEDRKTSTQHLTFIRAGSVLQVVDVGSTNGTRVNGVLLAKGKPISIEDGSVLRIGGTLLVFRPRLRGTVRPDEPLHGLVAPFGLRDLRRDLAALPSIQARNVLIEGETGSGKEHVAKAVHAALRPQGPFTPTNIAAVAPAVFESELFGHVRGAFTGADRDRPGYFVAARGGTLFLDELGDLAIDLQAKLLRAIEQREVTPVGTAKPVKVDVTIVAATHHDLDERVEAGTFRRDLLLRFVARLELPALRERPEDIMAIAVELGRRKGWRFDAAGAVEVEAAERLLLHDWRGNVRELEAVLDRAATRDEPGVLLLRGLGPELGEISSPGRSVLTPEIISDAEQRAGSEAGAAKLLGVTRGKLRRAKQRQPGG